MTKEEITNIINKTGDKIDPYDVDMVAHFLSLYFKYEDRNKISGYGLDVSDIDYRAVIYALNEIIIRNQET